MTGVYFVSTNNQKVGRVIVENPHVTFWYVEDAWENMSYFPGLLEFTRLRLCGVSITISVFSGIQVMIRLKGCWKTRVF